MANIENFSTNVIITFRVEGLHRWEDCNVEEVQFLRTPHRHIFHIMCKARVSHLDRQVEIICLKRAILAYISKKYGKAGNALTLDFGTMSCEMIAMELMENFHLSYCSVMEDGENGAEVIA